MSKKDYIAIAKIIINATIRPPTMDPVLVREDVIIGLADMFKADNPLFDRDRFISACNA